MARKKKTTFNRRRSPKESPVHYDGNRVQDSCIVCRKMPDKKENWDDWAYSSDVDRFFHISCLREAALKGEPKYKRILKRWEEQR